jgi:hypothetical protein
MDMDSEGRVPSAPVGTGASDLWIEILARVEQIPSIIGKALQDLASVPTGILVGASEHGTILLNARAWATFHASLKALQNLQVQHPNDSPQSRALKLYVLT